LNFLSPESDEKPCFGLKRITTVGLTEQIYLDALSNQVTMLVENVSQLIWIVN